MSLHDGVADYSWSYPIEKTPRTLRYLIQAYTAKAKFIGIDRFECQENTGAFSFLDIMG